MDQLLKQAEIDILGVDFNGDVHVLEVAFHQAGLNYVVRAAPAAGFSKNCCGRV